MSYLKMLFITPTEQQVQRFTDFGKMQMTDKQSVIFRAAKKAKLSLKRSVDYTATIISNTGIAIIAFPDEVLWLAPNREIVDIEFRKPFIIPSYRS